MLPVYKCLSESSLLKRCLEANTPNVSESFHFLFWSLMPKKHHMLPIAVETALHEAVLMFNAGCHRVTKKISDSLGLKPAHLVLRRAAEKDAIRMHKANNHHQAKTEKWSKRRVRKNISDYSAGSF